MKSDSLLSPITAFLVRALLRPRIHWCEGVDKKSVLPEPSLIVCNHTGHLDGPFVNTVMLPKIVHSLAAKDRFEQKGFGFLLRHTGCIPIDRKNPDTSWIKDSLNVFKAYKESISIFPEGRHGKHRDPLPFQPGAALLAAVAGVPVVVVYVDGPLRLLHRNRMLVSAPVRLPKPENGVDTAYIAEQNAFLEARLHDLIAQAEKLWPSA